MSAAGELPGMWEESDLSGGWADTDGTSARERLIRSVYNKLSQNQMEALVDDYAHELAEQVRAGHPDRCPDFADGAEWGADFIDPEVSE